MIDWEEEPDAPDCHGCGTSNTGSRTAPFLCEECVPERLEELRSALRDEHISQGELLELQELAEYINPGDVELLEAAGVPEFPEDDCVPQATLKIYVTLETLPTGKKRWKLDWTMLDGYPPDVALYCSNDCPEHIEMPDEDVPDTPTLHELANLILWTPELWNGDGTPTEVSR